MDEMDQFKSIFFEESFENLAVMESALVSLDISHYNSEEINTIFRAIHSIKGGSSMFALNEISQFSHVAETILDEIRNEQRPLSQETVDVLLQATDAIKQMLSNAQNNITELPLAVKHVQQQLQDLLNNAVVTDNNTGHAVINTIHSEHTSEDAEKSLKLSTSSLTPSLVTTTAITTNNEATSIRVATEKIDTIINLVGELVITQSILREVSKHLKHDRRNSKAITGLQQLEKNSRELQEQVMKLRMVPINTVFSRFPRLVRELSKQLNKKIDLRITGETTEIDKTFVEKISDPMVHLVRNALDHGIETSEQRAVNGKSATGTISLNAFHQGGNVLIEVSDDGNGLDKDRIIEKAIEKGIITSSNNMNDEQIYSLIFQPGFSTATAVTDISGRGVGMDVVQKNIKSLHGAIYVESVKGCGSTFTIRLPLTLSILDGQLFRVGSETYIIPMASVLETVSISAEHIKYMGGDKGEFYKLRENYIPVIRLYRYFEVIPDSEDLTSGMLIIAECNEDRVGIYVDEILSQQQIVIKSLEDNYRRTIGISGATILWNGHIALIIDIFGIVSLVNTAITHYKKDWFDQHQIAQPPGST